MGRLDEKIQEQEKKKEVAAAKLKERMELLKNMCTSKINLFKTNLEVEFYNAQQSHKSFSIIGRPILYGSQYRVNVSTGIAKEVEDAINDLFSFTAQGIVKALATMVISSIKEVITSGAGFEEECQNFYIVPENNAIVRVDLLCWRYNVKVTGLIGDVENAFCFLVCKSVVDHKNLTGDELIYFVTQALNGAGIKEVAEYIRELKKIWAEVENKSPELILKEYQTTALGHYQRSEGWEFLA